jgi:predicted enzyme related to lactoylglutathione lyase
LSFTVAHVFAALPVEEMDVAVPWYERFAGRAPDLVPHEREACWRMTPDAWIYVLVDGEQAGAGLVTLLIGDLDAFVDEVSERGLVVGATEPVPPEGRQVTLADPDGNRLKVAEVGG